MSSLTHVCAHICMTPFPDGETLSLKQILCRFESLRKFEVQGGLVAGTEDSRGKISLDRPNRQWGEWPPMLQEQ